MKLLRHCALPALIALTTLGTAGAADTGCHATAPATPPVVVELYTSEGCSSCPPADRWLSTLKGRPGVLALAFHVDYWDHLGWTDRYASREASERQTALARAGGEGGVYTPQVRVDGRDWRDWPRLPAAPAASAVTASLSRAGDLVTVQVDAVGAAPQAARFAGYWAVTEDGHQSRVQAGENVGATLHHDQVVRLYRPVASWPARQGHSEQLEVSRGAAEFPRRVVFVVTDAATQKPVQALALGC